MEYKVLHKPSGLYWKGGGMNKNNKSYSSIKIKNADGKWEYIHYDKNSQDHALLICFSKTGKTWSGLGPVKTALGYGHEPGLNDLLKSCILVELTSNIKEIKL